MRATVDLHMHTNKSYDGDFSPAEVVEKACRAGLQVIAITDHNTTAGVREAVEAGERLHVRMIPATELDCVFRDRNFHLLGYGIDPAKPYFVELQQDIARQERAASRVRVRLVKALGIPLDEETVMDSAEDGIVSGELIASIAFQHPDAAKNPRLSPYFPGGSRSDNPLVNFYWDYCSQGKPAYVPIHYIDMQTALRYVREAGGTPVLAHPGQNLQQDLSLLEDIIRLGVAGIECFSSYHPPEWNRIFYDFALRNKLLVSGGSDFHGIIKPSVFMGEYGLDADAMEMFAPLLRICEK